MRSIGSDGASIMTGRVEGVNTLLKKEKTPFMINIHCIAHRLQCTNQAARNVETMEKYIIYHAEFRKIKFITYHTSHSTTDTDEE